VNDDLARLAHAWGVATSYRDQGGRPHDVPEDTVRAVLDALGATSAAEAPAYPRVRHGGAIDVRCPLPPRTWGWMAQLYGVRSAASWGMGDLADLARLASWSAGEPGAGFVLVNPLHAVRPGLPQEPSPYFPASRRFVSPLYLAVEDLPELGLLDSAAREEVLRLGSEARALNDSALIDRDAIYRAKDRALRLLYAVDAPARRHALDEYRARQGAALEDFATWCALAERHEGPYQRWPDDVRHPRGAGVTQARDELRDEVGYHAWLQWLCAEQLAEAQRCARDAGMPVGLVLDLAVGVDPGGADAWAQQDDLATGFTVGAPPDDFNTRGQDWRLPPWRPDRLARSGSGPFRDLVRATVEHAGGIRVDHAMGLFRLWWIPDGADPKDGTYVRYPAEAMLTALAEECAAAGAVAVAENLGTVEPGVTESLRERGLLSSAVLWFEDGAPETYPEQAFASVTTHDLPTARGLWTDERAELTQEDRARVRNLLCDAGLAGDGATTGELVVAMHAFVARTPSLMAAVMLGDAVGETRQVNHPGTRDEYPNWRIPLPVALDDLAGDERVTRLVAAVRTARSRGLAAR
jgi:4-alpha-glucanotransferase